MSQYFLEVEESLPEALVYAKRAFELNENIENVQIRYVDLLLQAEQIVNFLNGSFAFTEMIVFGF